MRIFTPVLSLSFFLFLQISSVWCTETPTPTPREDLARYAKSHALHSGNGGSSGIHITDETVEQIAGPRTNHVVQATPVPLNTPFPLPPEEGKKYWTERNRALKKRIELAQAGLEKLKSKIPDVWDAFYHEDDFQRREQELRPRLALLLRKRQELDAELNAATDDLKIMKNEARKKGALPGWFRENSAR